MNGFLSELKRRNVIRMAGLYLVGAWLITQVSATVLPLFSAPIWMPRGIVIALIVGFIPAMIFAWIFEFTPDGLKRDADIPEAQSIAPQTAQKMNRLIVAMLVLAVTYFGFDKFVLAPKREAASVAAALQTVKTNADATAIEKSIAVLPFADMSQAKDQEYFSDGLSEEILNLLSQINNLKVIGRSSSFAFKGRSEDLRTIGATLGVRYLLEGSVRKAGNDLRIAVQLIEAESGAELWSQTYDRKLENVFAIQSEIAASIAQALRINLLEAGQSAPIAQAAASLPAYELFLQARRLIHGRTRAGITTARGLLDEALKLDPNYAPALAAQAQTLYLLNNTGAGYGDIPIEQAAALAKPLLERSLALDPNLAEAHAVQGLIFNSQRDVARAEVALAKALALNPNLVDALHWQAGLLGDAGRLRESLATRQRLDAIDPLNVANLWGLYGALRVSGKSSEARAVVARTLRNYPDNPQSFGAQATDLLNAGQLAEAQGAAARMLAIGSNWAPLMNGFVYYALGDFEKLLSLHESTKSQALIALGRNDQAVAVARERFAAAPEDRNAARDLLRTLSWAGRHDEVLALYRERWANLQGLDAYFGAGENGPLLLIATAQRALGQNQALIETLASWRKRLDFQREQGYASGEFVMTQARYFALANERTASLKALTKAIDLGIRDPLLGRDPAFAQLQADPNFKAQLSRMTKLINIERAKLKMAPLP